MVTGQRYSESYCCGVAVTEPDEAAAAAPDAAAMTDWTFVAGALCLFKAWAKAAAPFFWYLGLGTCLIEKELSLLDTASLVEVWIFPPEAGLTRLPRVGDTGAATPREIRRAEAIAT